MKGVEPGRGGRPLWHPALGEVRDGGWQDINMGVTSKY